MEKRPNVKVGHVWFLWNGITLIGTESTLKMFLANWSYQMWKTVKGVQNAWWCSRHSIQYTVCYAILKLETLHSFEIRLSSWPEVDLSTHVLQPEPLQRFIFRLLGNQKPACKDLHLADIWQYREPLRPGMLISPLQQLGNSKHLPTECTHRTALKLRHSTVYQHHLKLPRSFWKKKTISFGRSLDYIASVSTSCENIPPQATPMVHQHPPERPKLNESRQTMRIFPFAQWSCLFEDVLWTINRGEVGWSRYSHSTEMARATSFKFWPSILPRNSFHWRWKGISLVQPYPVHF